MAGFLSLQALALCLGTAIALQFPTQATSQYTNSSVATTTQAPAGPSASGAFCCQVYAPAAALNWWYTNGSIEAVRETVVTEYLRYNNTIMPTATVTITDSSAASVIGQYNLGAGSGPSFPGIPTTLNRPTLGGQQYDQTWVQTESVANLGYTTVASPTPFMAFGYIFVFSGTYNNAGTCMESPPTIDTITRSTSSASKGYNVYSEAMEWFGMAAGEPIGTVTNTDVQYTYLILSTPYISAVTTEAGEWYRPYKVTKLEDPFITWLAQDPQVLSAVPDIRSCSAVSGAGAPNVHVQVSFLTTSSAKTSTTNGLFINKATTTSAAPVSKITSEAPISTRKMSDSPTTKVIETPSTQPLAQPEFSPSTPAHQVSEETMSPSRGQDNPPKPSEISQDGSAQQTTAAEKSSQPSTQENKDENSAAPVVSSDGVVSSGGQFPTNVVEATTSGDQASDLPSAMFVISEGVPPESSGADGIQNTANQATSTSPVETTRTAPPIVIGTVTASHASSEGYIVGSQTHVPGSSAIEVSGTTYSLQESGNAAVVNGQDVSVSTIALPAKPSAPIALGEATGIPLTSDAYVVGEQTLSRGGSAIQMSGTTYSLEPSGGNIVVNGQSTPVSAIEIFSTEPVPIVIGDVTAVSQSSGAYLVAGQTLSRGGSAVEVFGTTYSLAPSGDRIMVNGEPTPISALQRTTVPPATVAISDITAVPQSSGAYYIVAGHTLSPSSAIEVSGVTYSLPKSGANVVINGATSYIATAGTPSPVTFGSITAVPFIAGGYIIASSQILSPGGSAVEVSGTTYSLPPSGNTVFIDGKPSTFDTAAADAIFTIGSGTYTAMAASATPLIVASQTLVPGGPAITVSGTTYSLLSSGTGNIVVNGATTTLAQTYDITVLSIGSQELSFTQLNSGVVIASQTLYPGRIITVNGQTLSLAATGGAIVVASGTETTTDVLGGYIWQGIASSATLTESSRASASFAAEPASESVSSSIVTGGARSRTETADIATTSRPTATGSTEPSAVATTTGQAGHLNIEIWMAILMTFVMGLILL